MRRFTSEDLARDGLNWYIYANNNPVMFNDLTGKATWFIHGTWSNNSTWTEGFKKFYKDKVFPGEAIETHGWSGANNDKLRLKEAKEFSADLVKFAKKNPDEPIRLVGHSHGGNFAIIVANEIAKENITVDTLITIATPVREYQLETNVGKHIQVYNTSDFVQVIGGENFIAGRTFESAINIYVEVPPCTEESKHSMMHSNVDVWEEYIYYQLTGKHITEYKTEPTG